ncbi:SDR family NAD(P)-dependent oxidoreductase [Paenibacillus nasutitermitis]|uniref:Gluconate 5-dehydrogenase n=1 Tax=Paenibacillus nasutitermitis TaxID=1652958 RepID=A0A916ZF41_9BACL|nr:SDR family NAD(P)-dependent oxidoreductase [Paenibacillus nasutitermitis]GGD93702.1 gluconate 5-dehydrogenase [Paenibacillus nasutitermitis]
MQRFVNRAALVTGAGQGIGYAIAERFAAEGAHVILADIQESLLLKAEETLQASGYSVSHQVLDVSRPEQVDDVVGRIVAERGAIDILANNAGIAWEEPFVDIKDDNWRRMIDVNLNGMFYVAQRVSRHMKEQGGGSIINMSSTNGLAGEAKYAHYNASKGAIVLLTKTMAIELGAAGIRVNAVCPGYIQTPMSEAIDDPEFVSHYIEHYIPLRRVGKPQDISGVFAFLASDDAAFIHGECIVVDGGQLA